MISTHAIKVQMNFDAKLGGTGNREWIGMLQRKNWLTWRMSNRNWMKFNTKMTKQDKTELSGVSQSLDDYDPSL